MTNDAADAPFRRRIMLALMVIAVLMGGVLTVESWRFVSGQRTREQIETQSVTLDIIRDTVDPGGSRYNRAQAAQTNAVGSINEISVIAAYCAKQFESLENIRECVAAEYQKLNP